MVTFQGSTQDIVNKKIVFNNKGEKWNYLSYLFLLEVYNALALVFQATASATSLVSLRTTRVFLMPLTALTEPRNLWRSIKRDTSCCILPRGCLPPQRQASFTLGPEYDDVYAPSEQHVCYTLRRGSTYVVAVNPTFSDVYAFHRLSAILYLSGIAIHRMLHSPI